MSITDSTALVLELSKTLAAASTQDLEWHFRLLEWFAAILAVVVVVAGGAIGVFLPLAMQKRQAEMVEREQARVRADFLAEQEKARRVFELEHANLVAEFAAQKERLDVLHTELTQKLHRLDAGLETMGHRLAEREIEASSERAEKCELAGQFDEALFEYIGIAMKRFETKGLMDGLLGIWKVIEVLPKVNNPTAITNILFERGRELDVREIPNHVRSTFGKDLGTRGEDTLRKLDEAISTAAKRLGYEED